MESVSTFSPVYSYKTPAAAGGNVLIKKLVILFLLGAVTSAGTLYWLTNDSSIFKASPKAVATIPSESPEVSGPVSQSIITAEVPAEIPQPKISVKIPEALKNFAAAINSASAQKEVAPAAIGAPTNFENNIVAPEVIQENTLAPIVESPAIESAPVAETIIAEAAPTPNFISLEKFTALFSDPSDLDLALIHSQSIAVEVDPLLFYAVTKTLSQTALEGLGVYKIAPQKALDLATELNIDSALLSHPRINTLLGAKEIKSVLGKDLKSGLVAYYQTKSDLPEALAIKTISLYRQAQLAEFNFQP